NLEMEKHMKKNSIEPLRAEAEASAAEVERTQAELVEARKAEHAVRTPFAPMPVGEALRVKVCERNVILAEQAAQVASYAFGHALLAQSHDPAAATADLAGVEVDVAGALAEYDRKMAEAREALNRGSARIRAGAGAYDRVRTAILAANPAAGLPTYVST